MSNFSLRPVILTSALTAVFMFALGVLFWALFVPRTAAVATADATGSTATGALVAVDLIPAQAASQAAGSAQSSGGRMATGTFTEDERQNIDVYDRVNNAVVNITTEVMAMNWFLEPVPQTSGTGSGSIIDARGYILTNYHVVADAYRLTVKLSDGSDVEATVVGTDPENDLAVIRFDPGGRTLTTISFGSTSELRVGQKVLAIGNPFGLDRTLTTGIVSALGRPVRTENGYIVQSTIQTDASINPGNSGGPLLNTRGEMIGINTMIYSTSGGSVGIGFAVPSSTAQRVVPELIANGRVQRGWIDIVPVQLFPQLVSYARLNVQEGLLVSEVTAGGNASQAGIQGGDRSRGVRSGNSIIYLGGDIIVGIDGTTIAGLADFYQALEDNRPGDAVEVVYLRGTQRRTTRVTLSPRPNRTAF